MKNYLPLFPLNLVAFPDESINLHIFEERYKQLINECLETQAPFGIPAYVKNSIEYGTEVTIETLVKKYDDGTMDITTRGRRVFEVIEFTNPVDGKLYAGGTIAFLDNIEDDDPSARKQMVALIKELYETINLVKSVEVDEHITTFDIGHKVGLSQEEEYALLQIEKESDRQKFIIEHLQKTIPVFREMERTKERIRMNGHFKYLDPLNF